MSRELRQLNLRAAALQGESDLLRLQMRDKVRDIGRSLVLARQVVALGVLAWRAAATLWDKRHQE